MFFTFNNILRHVVVLVVSFALLFPCVWLINKSYYTSISRVNYWEEKEIVSLLTFILKNTESDKIKKDLMGSLNEINFFDIKVQHNNEIIVDKPLTKYDLDVSSTASYLIDKYKIIITKRMYHSFVYDYKRYLKILFTEPTKLAVHQVLVVFVVHLNLILLLEILMITISVKYRLSKLTENISK